MDRLVKADVKELKLTFVKGQKCTTTFKLTNLMQTMSVAVALSTSKPNSFAFSTPPISLLPPLSTSTFSLRLSRPSDLPPLSSPPDSLTVRTSALPTGKASQEDLRRLFFKPPGSHIFKDAILPITFVGPHVVEFLFCPSPSKTLQEITFLLPIALSGCHVAELNSLLRSAAKCGYSYFVASLIDAGADPNHQDPDKSEPSILSLAIQSGDSKSVRTITESGYIPDSSDKLLHFAAEMNEVDLMKNLWLKLEEIDLDLTDSLGRTALHIAVIRHNLEVLKFLISIGCDPDIADSTGWTPLHYAASDGYLESVELLVNSSTYAKHLVTKDGNTAFRLAVEGGHSGLYDLLHLGDALHMAASNGDVREMKKCLADGAKVDSRDQNGWTPLHRAAFKGRVECVNLLIKNGAQFDIVENSGRTALRIAAEAGQLQVVSCLKAHGKKIMKGFMNHPSFVTTLCQEKERALIRMC